MAGKILIVDDDPDFKEAIATLLSAKGYNVIEASDGDEGFKKAKQEKPNLILLDVMMAHKTEGFDIARKISKDEAVKHIPVIITTGIRRDMTLSFSFEPNETWLPVKAVIEKPVKPDKLLGEIQKYI